MAAATGIAIAGIAGAAATTYAANRQSGAGESAARLQTDSANRSALLQARANRDQLAFLREQDTRQNAQYLDERGYNREQDAYARQQAEDAIARREPFRQISLGALQQLRNPINQSREPLYTAPRPVALGEIR